MHLIKVTLLLTFLALLNLTSAKPKVNQDWGKTLKCTQVALEALAAVVNNIVFLGKEMFDCVGYKAPDSNSTHLYKYLKIAYDFAKKLLVDKIPCLETFVKETVKILVPSSNDFEKMKCLE